MLYITVGGKLVKITTCMFLKGILLLHSEDSSFFPIFCIFV